MRIIFAGYVEFSLKALAKLVALKAEVVGVVTCPSSAFNADFCDLTVFCREQNIPCLVTENFNDAAALDWMRSLSPDIVMSLGNSQMLKKTFLSIAPQGVIGFHPALLPQNRGRHPLIWALALGLKETGSTFFFMDEGADTGDIINQVKIPICYEDDARTLYDKVTQTAISQMEQFIPLIKQGNCPRIKQDRDQTNVWRKRAAWDGQIHFCMNSRAIYNLVRALTKPYVGAHLLYQGQEIKIWRVREIEMGSGNDEFGKILNVDNGQITVRCCEGAICLVEHEFKILPKKGDYL
ncbi:MAG: formyl transferase [Candidatus Omnitrophica bacterium]|nr:formyl transferase [Candidatus Omnitrophota bacterium]